MPLSLENPIIVPAKTLDKIWLKDFVGTADSVGNYAGLNVTVIPYNSDGDVGEPIKLDEIDVFYQCAKIPDPDNEGQEIYRNPLAAQAYGLILQFVMQMAKEQGKV